MTGPVAANSVTDADRPSSYRWILAMLPADYRRARARELADTLADSDRGRLAESLALLGLLGRTWARRALSGNPHIAANAAATAAVLLPIMLLLPAFRHLWLEIWEAPGPLQWWGVSMTSVPGWTAWFAATLLIATGLPRWARALGLAGTGYQALLIVNLVLRGAGWGVVYESAWLLVQAIALALIWSPLRVDRGRRVVGPRHVWAVLVVLSLVVVTLHAALRLPSSFAPSWVALTIVGMLVEYSPLLALIATGVLLLSRTGRALLPIAGAAVAAPVTAMTLVHDWQKATYPFAGTEFAVMLRQPTAATFAVVLMVPVVTFLALRVMAALATVTSDRLLPALRAHRR